MGRTVLAGILVLTFIFWVTALYVPARFIWNNEVRLFVVQIPMFVPYLVVGAWTLVFAPTETARFHKIGFVTFVVMLILGVYHAFLMNESNPGGAIVASPCGQSSCSAQESDSSVVYNPSGFFDATKRPFTDKRATICVYEDCRWASSNQRPALGYRPLTATPGYPDYAEPCTLADDPCLATNRKGDWPNGAIGIGGGFWRGFGTRLQSANATCPGTEIVGGAIVGAPTCAYCVGFMRRHFPEFDVAAGCPSTFADDATAQDNIFWCGLMCPKPYESRTPTTMRKIVVYWFVVASLPVSNWFVDRATK